MAIKWHRGSSLLSLRGRRVLRHGADERVDELHVVHDVEIGVEVLLRVQRGQVGHGGRRARGGRGLDAEGRRGQVRRVRRQGDVLEVGGEGALAPGRADL